MLHIICVPKVPILECTQLIYQLFTSESWKGDHALLPVDLELDLVFLVPFHLETFAFAEDDALRTLLLTMAILGGVSSFS